MPIFIGDVHGHFDAYKRIIKQVKGTHQVGDLGVGFKRQNGYGGERWYENPPHALMTKQGATFNRGNHDNPGVCRKHSQCIPDGTVKDDMMFVGGAISIDRKYRTENYDWWPDEECTPEQFRLFRETMATVQPNCMVTHDCPRSIYPMLVSHHLKDRARTPDELEAMWQIHKPKVWIFGHHHKSFDAVVDGTRFVCLAELEVKEINWER
jgi:hypothetical protein